MSVRLGSILSVIGDSEVGEGGQVAVEGSMGKYGDQYDEWDVRDQGGTCHNAAAESPCPGVY